MGVRELDLVSRCLPWIRKRSRAAARGCASTDTDEVCSSSIRRAAAMPDGHDGHDRFADTGRFRACMSTVIRHVVVDHVRKAKVRTTHETLAGAMRKEPGCDHERVDRIEDTLEEMMLLDSGSRAVMELHARGLTSTEIAAHYGMPASTVRTRIGAAKKKIADRSNKDNGVGQTKDLA